MKIASIIKADTTLSCAARQALLGAITSRGARKGYVLASLPKRPDARIGWRALMSVLCVQRAGIMSMLWASAEERALSHECDAWAEKCRTLINVYGQRPMQFNLYEWHHPFDKFDHNRIRALLERQDWIDARILDACEKTTQKETKA